MPHEAPAMTSLGISKARAGAKAAPSMASAPSAAAIAIPSAMPQRLTMRPAKVIAAAKPTQKTGMRKGRLRAGGKGKMGGGELGGKAPGKPEREKKNPRKEKG